MNDLTKYELDMFMNLETLTVESGWYNVKPDRKDIDRFIAVIKKRIDRYNDFEFNGSYTQFRRVEAFKMPNTDNITYSIQWREDTGELTEKEKNLPEPKWKSYAKGEWDKLIGRK